MSKLISGDAKIADLDLVREAAKALGWRWAVTLPVLYYAGPGPVCDLIVAPHGELNRRGDDVGEKYSIGFQQDKATGKITMLHDNAMNGQEVYSVESGQQDETTQRVVGKLKQAIAEVQLRRIYSAHRANWRTEIKADGTQVHVINRGR
jgi:hypothetical protein